MKSLVILAMLLVLDAPRAGVIRSLRLNSQKMESIYLSLGQSTILRFIEKPKRVVIGNQNYFNVEFIGSDITIQPKGVAKTNLFVYGEYRTYGFILNVDTKNQYDDLVKVYWKSSPVKLSKKKSNIEKRARKSITLRDEILCIVDKVKEIKKGFFIVDLRIINKSSKELNTNNFELFVGNKKKRLNKQNTIYSKNQIQDQEMFKARILFKTEDKKNTFLYLKVLREVKRVLLFEVTHN